MTPTADRWLSRESYEPETPMVPPVDRGIERQAIVEALAESLKDAGVMDAPEQVRALGAAHSKLDAENKSLQAEVAELRGGMNALLKSLDVLKSQPPAQAPQTTLNLSSNGLAEQLGKVLAGSVADVINKTLDRAVSKPHVEVKVDTANIAQEVAKGLAPVLKSIAERQPDQHSIDTAPIAKTLERLEAIASYRDPPQPIVYDNAAVAKALADMGEFMRAQSEQVTEQSRLVRKALERLDGHVERQEIVQKSLTDKLTEPPPVPEQIKKTAKKLTQQYDGSYLIEEVDAP